MRVRQGAVQTVIEPYTGTLVLGKQTNMSLDERSVDSGQSEAAARHRFIARVRRPLAGW